MAVPPLLSSAVPVAMNPVAAVRSFLSSHPDADATPCPCGAAEDLRLARRDRHGLPCSLVLCRACGLVRADPQPSEESLRWFYAHVYGRLLRPHGVRFEAMAAAKGNRVAAFAGTAYASVVDIGCGGGWSLVPFAGTRVGYDFDEALMDVGRRQGLDLRCGGPARAADDGVRADLSILSHVLEHVKQPLALLQSLQPIVAPGGRLYVEVPNMTTIGARLRGDAGRYWQRAHLWDFQPEHLDVLLRRAGWAAVQVATHLHVTQMLAEKTTPEDRPLPRLGADVEERLRHMQRVPWRRVRAAARTLRQIVRA